MTPARKIALDAMHDAAAAGFDACQAHGKNSPIHLATFAVYAARKAEYEAVCAAEGVAAYAEPQDW